MGVAEPVAADESVLAEELRKVEVGERGVEERQRVLVAEGHAARSKTAARASGSAPRRNTGRPLEHEARCRS